jgi:hypothetical protein
MYRSISCVAEEKVISVKVSLAQGDITSSGEMSVSLMCNGGSLKDEPPTRAEYEPMSKVACKSSIPIEVLDVKFSRLALNSDTILFRGTDTYQIRRRISVSNGE